MTKKNVRSMRFQYDIYIYIYIVDISYMGLLSHIKYQDDNLIFDYIIGVIIFLMLRYTTIAKKYRAMHRLQPDSKHTPVGKNERQTMTSTVSGKQPAPEKKKTCGLKERTWDMA